MELLVERLLSCCVAIYLIASYLVLFDNCRQDTLGGRVAYGSLSLGSNHGDLEYALKSS